MPSLNVQKSMGTGVTTLLYVRSKKVYPFSAFVLIVTFGRRPTQLSIELRIGILNSLQACSGYIFVYNLLFLHCLVHFGSVPESQIACKYLILTPPLKHQQLHMIQFGEIYSPTFALRNGKLSV